MWDKKAPVVTLLNLLYLHFVKPFKKGTILQSGRDRIFFLTASLSARRDNRFLKNVQNRPSLYIVIDFVKLSSVILTQFSSPKPLDGKYERRFLALLYYDSSVSRVLTTLSC